MPSGSGRKYSRVRVFYGTDRAPVVSNARLDFGPDRGPISFGWAEVTIPEAHRAGQLESPSWLRLEFRSDPDRHVTLDTVRSLRPAEWTHQLTRALAVSDRGEALLYVHGYNVTFEDAARRTGQLAYDLGFDGAPLFYSWPSQGSYEGYPADEAVIDRSVPLFLQFLDRTLHTTPVRRIHLIAHSMGSRLLAAGLVRLPERDRRRIGQVIFTAPDIDAEVFQRDIAPVLTRSYDRVSLYSSSADRALLASQKFHQFPRAGMSGPGLIVQAGLETIDASRVDTDLLGHGYYASNKQVLDDLFMLIERGLPAQSRNLKARAKAGVAYWELP